MDNSERGRGKIILGILFLIVSLFLCVFVFMQYREFKKEYVTLCKLSEGYKTIASTISKRSVMFHENQLSKRFPEFSENFWSQRASSFNFLKWKLRFHNVLPYLKKNGWILDIGCWDAYFTLQIAKSGFETVGLEISKEELIKAKKRFTQAYMEKQFFGVLADGAHLPFREGKFSSISCLDVLEHVPDWKNLLKEANHVLKRDGLLTVITPCRYHVPLSYTSVFWFFHKFKACLTRNELLNEKRMVSNHEWREKKDQKLFVEEAPFIVHLDFTPYELKRHLSLIKFEVVTLYTIDFALEDFIASKIYNITSINLITCLRKLRSTLPIMRYVGNEIFIVCKKR